MESILVDDDEEFLRHELTRILGEADGRRLFDETSRREDVVALPSVGCTLDLAEVCDKVELAG